MDAPEYLIEEYGLTDWESKHYKGPDPDKRCVPALKSTYNGLLRHIDTSSNDDSED